ncbi:PREDICTED: U-box domain-containing protein 44-like isoform X2 [Nelumbo nucifera]|uniref:RING-type E3 ubiquitin transferase n=1 Tax=Nelumbo nucifera TaxID=4432 RepID=A0A1U7ZFN3_NELNU|nr:PREDICTED: U-box domain-containing protein 44-like isoform X2 [Nelumbo nucifera]
MDIFALAELLDRIIETIAETAEAAKDVLVEKEGFAKLSSFLEKVVPILKELTKKNISNSESLNNAIENFDREVKAAKQLVLECRKRNKVYLFLNCRRVVKRLEQTTREISRALSFIPLASLDLSSSINEDISNLCDNMQRAEFKAAVAEEEILEKIELGILERNVDRTYANNLMVLIAEAVGISTERSALKKEFEDFKREIEDTQVRKDQAEAIQMDQIVALLERADATSSPREKEMKYFTKRKSLGNQPLEPLQSFYCPITRDVMVDPVETSSGQTFERDAIQKWFADGNTICPLTMIPLDTAILRPNKTLRQSIEEWRDRNIMITIASMKPKLHSDDEQEILHSLEQLQDLCMERDLHREWVTLENYIPILIGLLSTKNREIRNHVLDILCILAKDSDDTKERIAEVENAIEAIVRSLARRISESKLAVALLLELSKSNMVRNYIGKVQGCILLLVTMSTSDDTQAAKDAKELLENLSFLDENVVQMAKANYFRPLLERLSSGPEDVKMIMLTTLAEMELSDHNKLTLFENGVLKPLLHLVTNGNEEMKRVSVKAIQNLSTLPRNALQMIQEGAVGPLLDLLYRHNASMILREQVASTIMNLAISTAKQEAKQTEVTLLEYDEDIFKLFSLVNLTAPTIQQKILRTFHAMCQHPSTIDIRSKLRQCSAIQMLVQFCEVDDIALRANALKLFFCLTEDGDDGSLSEYVDQRCIGTLIRIIRDCHDEEEITAALGIISNLPMKNIQITQWLLDAEALPVIFRFLTNGKFNGSYKNDLIENAVGATCRFTVSTNLEWQKRAAEAGIIPVLVQLLSSGTALTKQHAATSLAQFSESSVRLSRPIKRHRGLWCCSPPPEVGCPVHMGICTVELSFCLVEAGAVQPLVTILGESDFGASKASLQALLTLIDGERLQSGSKVLAEANAIPPIIKLLGSPSTELQERALLALERIFRLIEFKQKYGASAQMPLVDLTQRGNSTTKPLAARILAHLNVLHESSSYF